MDFSETLLQLKKGNCVAREGWNMYIEVQVPSGSSKMTRSYLVMVIPGCAEGVRYTPWQPAQVDLFANDWSVV